ncbi:hypothetical protein J7U46_09710 [Pelomonas sp. V22]|uniref:hypothetical protein n=1 Tax=Pelomonas sp. V22 TaxID=2822139 RepID=UPI0024A82198|nr:hypothetical protein [Pelomonas sp. V22]MDI4633322.1 hypothetical protein [Pelomonas sp. V22]
MVVCEVVTGKARGAKPTRRAIWKWSGLYQLDAVGESFNYEALNSFEWPKGFDGAVVLCAAQLVHQPENEHDGNAVAIFIDDLHVGHLSRMDAVAYHQRVQALGLSNRTTWANCLISGSHLEDEQRRFSVQLDMDFESDVLFDAGLAHDQRLILPKLTPVFIRSNGYGFAAVSWLPLSAVNTCRPGDRLKVWRKPDSDELFLFAPGTIGSMGRILMVTDDLLKAYGFNDASDFVPIVYSAGLRDLTIFFKLPQL